MVPPTTFWAKWCEWHALAPILVILLVYSPQTGLEYHQPNWSFIILTILRWEVIFVPEINIHLQFKEDYSQVMVILCDFKERKFQIRQPPEPKETSIPSLSQIEDALNTCKTKLNAALARSRIKARVLSIDHLLPDSVRQNDKIGSNMHMYCWVNQIKTTWVKSWIQDRIYGHRLVEKE